MIENNYPILPFKVMVDLNVGETLRHNFLLCLLKMYEQAVDEYNQKKLEEGFEL